MQLHYHQPVLGNFGDDLNQWIWDDLIPDIRQRGDKDDVLVGLGSILHANRFTRYKSRIAVMGTGYNRGEKFDKATFERCHIYAVRGPLTKAAFNLDDSVAMLDPGQIVPDLQKPASVRHGRALFIPHYNNLLKDAPRFPLADIVEDAGLELLSPELDSRFVLEKISGASLVVSESLHGAIVADAYRVPWVPVKFGPRVTPFKWKDWGASLDLDIDFINIFPVLNFLYRLEHKALKYLPWQRRHLDWRQYTDRFGGVLASRLIKGLKTAVKTKPNLSKDDVLDRRKFQFYQAIEEFKNDFR